MPRPLDARKKPTGIKIHVTTGAGVDIVWSDAHESHYDFNYLRDLCPCATCNDDRAKKAEFSTISAGTPSAVLPMFRPKPKARAAHPVGNYAIQIEFTDGHNAGIYSFDYLRTICPCEDCGREFRPSEE
ncbi:MAG TPA: DUF971 domain-containing protein [Methylomirabilota bacterium]|nr:DUF971 domain-containing protein [Methylomirabilota bacterium]